MAGLNEHNEDFIRIIKDRLTFTAATELDVTGDDYINSIESIYGNIYSENLRKFYRKIAKDMPEIPKDKFLIIFKDCVSKWDGVLREQIDYFQGFTENLFKVPATLVLEPNVIIHEAITNYSAKENQELDEKIEKQTKNIEQKKKYMDALIGQCNKLEVLKNEVFTDAQ